MAGIRLNHWLTFSAPGFVPTSTDEISARETTGAVFADVGVTPSDLDLVVPDPNDVDVIGYVPPTQED